MDESDDRATTSDLPAVRGVGGGWWVLTWSAHQAVSTRRLVSRASLRARPVSKPRHRVEIDQRGIGLVVHMVDAHSEQPGGDDALNR